jgi:nitrile hydratase beta subunit
MDGIHDMGGMDGFGKVEAESNEPTFHEKWEGRVMAMVRAVGANGGLNIDMQRFSRESLPPVVYLESSYYQKWFLALEQSMLKRGMIGPDEVQAGHSLHASPPLLRGTFEKKDVERIMTRGSFAREPRGKPAFAVGDRVRTKNIHPATHTRLPRYARDKTGVIERINGCHVFPDTNAHGKGDNPQWLYTVVFDGAELWGRDSESGLKVSIEAFEPYLDPACQSSTRPRRAVPRRKCRASRAMPRGRYSANRGKLRLSPWRWRCTSAASSPGRNGRRRSPPRSSALRRPVIPTPARLTTCTGSMRWSGWSPRKASLPARPCTGTSTPGSMPASARRTASRSN